MLSKGYKNCNCDWCLMMRWNDKPFLEKIWILYTIWWNYHINKFRSDWKDYTIDVRLENGRK